MSSYTLSHYETIALELLGRTVAYKVVDLTYTQLVALLYDETGYILPSNAEFMEMWHNSFGDNNTFEYVKLSRKSVDNRWLYSYLYEKRAK